VKRSWSVLVAALVLTGCMKSAPPPSQPPSPPPATPTVTSETPSQVQTTPVAPDPIDGPIYLLAQPEKPLWAGPTSVVIENSPQARPQSGLNDADLVIESLAESEISRTLAFYWSHPVAKIGPVRSARSFFVTIAGAYGAPLAHAGGNMDALATLRQSWGGKNLDEIFNGGGYFWRSRDREAPHNLYTSTDLLGAAVRDRKLSMAAVPVTPHAADPTQPSDPITRADITWHSLHHVTWEWDGKQYVRLEEGQTPHTLDTGEQIHTLNLIFLEVQGTNHGPDDGWSLAMAEGGKATVVTGGRRWEGRWTLGKDGFSLQPANGKVSPLLPGNTWVHLINPESSFKLSQGQ
jgi:hypothetical protein